MGLGDKNKSSLYNGYEKLLRLNYNIDLKKLNDYTPEGMNKKDIEGIVDFDIEQIFKGIDEEMEHTSDPYIALNIAIDHLEQDPYYYSDNSNE
jgi:hypothetical protein